MGGGEESVRCVYGDRSQGCGWLIYYNFEYDWLIELSHDKLSDNNLASE